MALRYAEAGSAILYNVDLYISRAVSRRGEAGMDRDMGDPRRFPVGHLFLGGWELSCLLSGFCAGFGLRLWSRCYSQLR